MLLHGLEDRQSTKHSLNPSTIRDSSDDRYGITDRLAAAQQSLLVEMSPYLAEGSCSDGSSHGVITSQAGNFVEWQSSGVGQPEDESRVSRRSLLQMLDPLSNPLRTTACVKDSSIFPFSAFGKIVTNTSIDSRPCAATLIAPNAAITRDYCLEVCS